MINQRVFEKMPFSKPFEKIRFFSSSNPSSVGILCVGINVNLGTRKTLVCVFKTVSPWKRP